MGHNIEVNDWTGTTSRRTDEDSHDLETDEDGYDHEVDDKYRDNIDYVLKRC